MPHSVSFPHLIFFLTFNLGQRRTADGYYIKQPVVFVFFKRPTGAVESRARPWSRPLAANRLSEALVSLSVRSDFGLSWYVVQFFSPTVALC